MLLLQDFDLEIRDRKGTENQVADHLSRLERGKNAVKIEDIQETFPYEQLLAASLDMVPWYVDIANYLATSMVPSNFSPDQKKKFFRDYNSYFWDDPYLFRICVNNMIRRCVPE